MTDLRGIPITPGLIVRRARGTDTRDYRVKNTARDWFGEPVVWLVLAVDGTMKPVESRPDELIVVGNVNPFYG